MTKTREIILEDGEKEVISGIQYAVEYDIDGQGYRAKLSLDHYNRRIRVLDYEGENIKDMVLNIRELSQVNNFDKIIFMATEDDWEKFLTHGYTLEAIIRYYHDGNNAYVMSKFRSQERVNSSSLIKETKLIEQLMESPPEVNHDELTEGYDIRMAERSDIPDLANLYDEVFESYPTPLGKIEYIEKVFEISSLFTIITYQGKIVASASAEFLSKKRSAELTDCATLKSHRKKGLMTIVIRHLEKELRRRDYQCGFSMARAQSYGMNQIFYNLGYHFMGRLVNHCDIYGSFEDMNIWVKSLKQNH